MYIYIGRDVYFQEGWCGLVFGEFQQEVLDGRMPSPSYTFTEIQEPALMSLSTLGCIGLHRTIYGHIKPCRGLWVIIQV